MLKSRLASDVCCFCGKGYIWNKIYGIIQQNWFKKNKPKSIKNKTFRFAAKKKEQLLQVAPFT